MQIMAKRKEYSLFRFVQFIPIWVFLTVGKLLPFGIRGPVFSALGRALVTILPGAKRRVISNLRKVYPEASDAVLHRLARGVGANTARSLSELLFNHSYRKRLDLFSASGPGFEILKEAKRQGRGAIIVSAHFGQWEAIRHYLKAQDMETGAIYRENSNPFYERRFLKAIRYGGEPIVARSTSGNKTMIRHLRKGGFFALLVDQKHVQGEMFTFLGLDAWTSTSPAELALRYDLELVPAFARRMPDGNHIDIEFQPAIAHSSVKEMTQEINDRISEQILAAPDQWYWLHQRWKYSDGNIPWLSGAETGPSS